MRTDDKYLFEKEAKIVAEELTERMNTWVDFLSANNLRDRWRKSYQLYYGRHFQGTFYGQAGVKSAGDQGQLKLVTVNHFRNLVKHVLVLTTSQKPSFDVRAINSDPSSLEQAKLGNDILNAYLGEKRLLRYIKVAAEHALIFGKGFVEMTWDKQAGKPYTYREVEIDGETRTRVEYEGDIDIHNLGPLDVYYDPTTEDFNKLNWYVSRRFKNKWNLIAEHQELKTNILELQSREDMQYAFKNSFKYADESDDVPVFTAYHKRSPAMPNGRMIVFSDSETIYYDGPIPYDDLPLLRIVTGEIFQTTEGYSDAYDLIDLSEVYNNIISAMFSNFNATAVQTILVPNTSNITPQQIGNLRIIKYDPQMGKPESLQLTSNPPDIYNALGLIERLLETMSGVNSVARGNVDSLQAKSGVALSLIQSMAVQYSSGFQSSWAELLEDAGTKIIDYLKTFAKTDRLIAIAGKSNRKSLASFKGDDLTNIDRVIVDLGNPMARTVFGRLDIADKLIDKGLIKTPQEYVTVLETGNLEPLTQPLEQQLSNIHSENDFMLSGKRPQVLISDAHLLHCQEHLGILSNPEIRNNPALMQMVLDHVQEHKDLYQTQDPFFAMVNGEPPNPVPPPPPMGVPGPGGPMPPPPPEQGPPLNDVLTPFMPKAPA